MPAPSQSPPDPWVSAGIRFAVYPNNGSWTLAWSLPGREGRERRTFRTPALCRAHAREVAEAFRARNVALAGEKAADYRAAVALLREAGLPRARLAEVVAEWLASR